MNSISDNYIITNSNTIPQTLPPNRIRNQDKVSLPGDIFSSTPEGEDIIDKNAALNLKQAIFTKLRSSEDGNQPEPTKTATVMIYPQDATISEPEPVTVDRRILGNNLNNGRFVIIDEHNPLAEPDANGNYIFSPDQPQFTQIQTLVTATQTLEMAEKYIGRKIILNSGENPTELYTNHLPHNDVPGHSYDAAMAFYNGFIIFSPARPSYSSPDKPLKTDLVTDTISHETGHEVDFAVRPIVCSFAKDSKESKAFRESFADSMAMLHCISRETNIQAIIDETGGDLSKQNRMSVIEEPWSHEADGTLMLNTGAINDFKYLPEAEIAYRGNIGELCAECHVYGKVFEGGFYGSFKNIYEKNLTLITAEKGGNRPPSGEDMAEAIRKSRDTIGQRLMKAMEIASPSNMKFKRMALAMIKADEILGGGTNRKEIENGFLDKGIITKSDLKKYDEEQRKLPELKLDKPLNSGKDANDLLNKEQGKLRVNAGDFDESKTSITKDDYGLTCVHFYHYYKVMERSLKDENSEMVTQGGVTLMFDRNNVLVSRMQDGPQDYIIPKPVGK